VTKGDGFPSAQKVVQLSRQRADSNRSGCFPIRIAARDLSILRNTSTRAAAAAVKQYITDLLKSVSLAALFLLVRLSYVSKIGCPPEGCPRAELCSDFLGVVPQGFAHGIVANADAKMVENSHHPLPGTGREKVESYHS
jgi:hypothetical protein